VLRLTFPRAQHVIRILAALLVVCGVSWPASAEDTKPLTTILLVAREGLPDSNFKRSVVLVMNHIGPAPAGVIINRPTRVTVGRLFPDIERLGKLDDKIYFGGPVQSEIVSFVFRADKAPEDAAQVLPGVFMSTDSALLRKLLSRDKPMEGLRIFAGYSGWAPGQLENEIARGDWTLAPADIDTIFGGKAEYPWPDPQAPGAGQRT
jgi:putative transcriptional regulator